MCLLIGVSGIISPKDLKSMQHREIIKPCILNREGRGKLGPEGHWLTLDAPWTPPRLSFFTYNTAVMCFPDFSSSKLQFFRMLVGTFFFIRSVKWSDLSNTDFKQFNQHFSESFVCQALYNSKKQDTVYIYLFI